MKNRIIPVLLLILLTLGSSVFGQTILAGRGISISVQGVPPEEKGRIDSPAVSVSEAGTIRMPFLGEVHVAGMTTNAAAAKLEAAYRNAGIYTTPTFQISATVAGGVVRNDFVTIGGFVRAAGPKPWTPGLTIYQAVIAAGGANEFGDVKRTLLMRGKLSRTYNLNNLQDRNIELQADDTIEVPEKFLNPFR